MRISDWSSDVCSSVYVEDQIVARRAGRQRFAHGRFDRIQAIDQHGRQHTDEPAVGIVAITKLAAQARQRSEEHTSELQSLMRISYAVFCLKKKTQKIIEYLQATHTNDRTTY